MTAIISNRFKIPAFIINLFSVYSANMVNGILGIIAVPLVVNALGEAQYGIYSIYIVLALYVSLVDLGVSKHMIRLMSAADSDDEKGLYLQKAFGWYLALLVFLFISLPAIIYIAIEFLFPVPTEFRAMVRWIVILTVIEYMISIPVMLIQAFSLARQSFNRYSTFIASSGFSRYLFMIVSALIFQNAVYVVLFLLVKRGIDIILCRFILPAPPKNVWRPKVNFREFFDILKNSSIMSLTQFLQTIIISFGAILINRHYGVRIMGNYRAAFDLVGKVWFFSNGIGLIIFPKFSKLLSDDKNREKLGAMLKLFHEKSWLFYLMISITAILVSPYILPLINFGDEQKVFFFTLLVLGTCINAHTNVSYEFILADNKYKWAASLSFLVLVMMTIFYFTFLKWAGPYSIGWAWIASQSLFAIGADHIVSMNTRIDMASQWKTIFFKSALLAAAIVYLLSALCIFHFNSITYGCALWVACAGLILKDTRKIIALFKSKF